MVKRVRARPDQRGGRLAQNWKHVFLETLAEHSNVSRAAAACGALPAYVYKLRREDDDFARKWSAALLEGYEHLELETLERLRFGTAADGPKFDIANALRLLAAHREAAAREKARRGHRDQASVLASLNAKIDRMRAQQIAKARGARVRD